MAKKGGQKGNQNARKHGFYSYALTEAEKLLMEEALELQGSYKYPAKCIKIGRLVPI